MDCPNCKLINPPGAVTCDCGYDFDFVAGVVSPRVPPSLQRRGARVWQLVLGGFLILNTVGRAPKLVSGSSVARREGLPEFLGQLSGLLLLTILGIGLIAAGLPKTINLERTQRQIRRRIWYGLAGIGLLVMIAACTLLIYLNLLVAAVLVTWLYWFGWTWVSWIIADKKAARRFTFRQGRICGIIKACEEAMYSVRFYAPVQNEMMSYQRQIRATAELKDLNQEVLDRDVADYQAARLPSLTGRVMDLTQEELLRIHGAIGPR